MSSTDIDIVNCSYSKIKRARGESVPKRETDYVKDPLYKTIYDLKHQSVMHVKARSKTSLLKLQP